MQLTIDADGVCQGARQVPSPNHDARPAGEAVSLVVIHNISLPPGQFGGDDIERLFTNRIDPQAHPGYDELARLRVSAHFVIRRDGALVQFVPAGARAWHAGVSNWCGRERCNDFSVGIELEGSDHVPFAGPQYATLLPLLAALAARYPLQAIAGHSEIAPGRKTDPGPWFDWARVHAALPQLRTTFSALPGTPTL
ncbi:1,6-anhydro-N-acetylmuramyl-L-alanine amidase AmpD [Chitiniphilus purpureus]|uniref:1,6-anhydro-N-acetylmuramyl-L-alanine amidase AmpD n=1 Tax=Chitiniphilus purpureus TaxID=2981137 RepID=A0ABY6DTD8_9NEIS|nr:1,6-anhydro-N-acetylmuramyl-L-alanine amidase AmpD [Chitiniphilus sp. CD1]UXY17282.1 1,6-anhydro-N-acetylmuramyl-L-alanine amidase AmpD [Chitiniphilus sp. CD1]